MIQRLTVLLGSILLLTFQASSNDYRDSLYKVLKEGNHTLQKQTYIKLQIQNSYLNENLDTALSHAYKIIAFLKANKAHDSLLLSAYTNTGITYWYKQEFDSAELYFERSLELALRSKSNVACAQCYDNLAVLAVSRNRIPYAMQQIRLAEVYANKGKKSAQLAKIFMDYGMIYNSSGKQDSALLYYIKASTYYEDVKDYYSLSFLYNGLGNLYNKLGRFEEALPYFRKALIANKKSDMISNENLIYSNIAFSYLGIEDKRDSALWYIYHVLDKINHDPKDELYLGLKINEGIVHFKDSAYSKALELNNKILKLEGIDNDPYKYASLLNNTAICYFHLQQIDSCLHFSQLAIDVARKGSLKDIYRKALETQTNAYKELGDFENALKNHLLVDSIVIAQMSFEKDSALKVLENQLVHDSAVRENELLKKEKARVKQSRNIIIGISTLGTIFAILLFVRTSRHRRKLEALNKQLRKNTLELEELNQTKDRFFSILSHDLKGPIGSSHLLLQILVDGHQDLDEKTLNNYLNMLMRSSKSTYDQLVKLLEWSKLQRGMLLPHKSTIDMNTFYASVHEQLEPIAQRKDVELVLNCTRDCTVFSDQNMLTSIILNLTTNAIKFSPRGSAVELTSVVSDTEFNIQIQDHGIGMPKDVQEKLFDLSYIEHRNGTEDEPGTGLGLIIVKEFTEVLNGRIDIHSEEGKGTQVNVRIPLN